MSHAPRFFTTLALTAMFLAPFSASALVPIGGKVVAEVPCSLGGLMITVVGFGIGSGLFWYMPPPATLTFLYGPPLIGEWILGNSDVPSVCGLRATMVGTSPI